MLLLAFDTATPAITVALHDGASVLAAFTTVDARRTGEVLAPGIADVLSRSGRTMSEVTGIAVGVGPGPFTGLRVGLVTARTLGDALEVPVHGVCTLDVLAYATDGTGLVGPFAVATDARRKEVYWAAYADALTRTSEPDVTRPGELVERLSALPVVGEGPYLYPGAFPSPAGPRHPDAGILAALVALRLATDPSKLSAPDPMYLRRPDAVEPAARKKVSAG